MEKNEKLLCFQTTNKRMWIKNSIFVSGEGVSKTGRPARRILEIRNIVVSPEYAMRGVTRVRQCPVISNAIHYSTALGNRQEAIAVVDSVSPPRLRPTNVSLVQLDPWGSISSGSSSTSRNTKKKKTISLRYLHEGRCKFIWKEFFFNKKLAETENV